VPVFTPALWTTTTCSHAQTNDHLPSLSALTLTAAVPIDNPKTSTHRTRKHSDA